MLIVVWLTPPTAIVGEVGRPVSGGRLSAFFAVEDEDEDDEYNAI